MLGETRELHSAILSETRTLNIYLPAGYSEAGTTTYPVIYLLDGSADEDFIHVTGLVQFATFPWVNILPNSIVVGIGNTDRKRDFTFPTTIEADKKDFPTTGGSANFIAFITTELQPFITSLYRTNGSSTLIGQSLGGLLATEVLLGHPQLFTQYIIVSPSLWWDDGSLLNRANALPAAANTAVYIAVGKEEKPMKRQAKQLASLLRKRGGKHLQVEFEYLPDEDHATIMHEALYRAFRHRSKTSSSQP